MIMLFEISNYFYSPDFISNETQIEGFFFLINNQFKYFKLKQQVKKEQNNPYIL